MTPRLVMLADDFTGALDAGVRLARAGAAARVTTTWNAARLPWDSAPVLVVDTESRHLDPREAAQRVAACVRAAIEEGVSFFYKKTDSTLRGNIGAELAAMLSETGEDCLFFVPALPAAGRTTVNGVALLDAAPLHRTLFAADPRDPVTESAISAIIHRQTSVPVHVVRRGADSWQRGGGGARILLFDAETDADLREIGRQIKAAGLARATAGCSGFASVLPWLLDLPAGPVQTARMAPPMLVVCGSLHEASLQQVRNAEETGVPSFALEAGARAVAEALAQRGAVIVKGSPGAGELVRDVVSRVKVSTLVLFGGDTAFAVMEALGVETLFPVDEISQGVVVSRVDAPFSVVTKAGGFGPPDVLLRILDALRKEP